MKKKTSCKILIISGSEHSEWISCQSIRSGLITLYSNLFNCASLRHHTLDHNANIYDCLILAKTIKTINPNKIIFLDYRPSPSIFIQGLLLAYKNEIIPPLLFHIYGDFVLNIPDWINLIPSFSLIRIKFITASHKQREVLKKLFLAPNDVFDILPFPVSTEIFKFNKSERTKFRKHHEINNQFVVTYAGRLSSQKNIIELIRCYKKISILLEKELLLFLAGPIDDLAIPYLGTQEDNGTYQRKIISEIENDSSISYLGNLTHSQLSSLFNGSDLMISLSTHNDEDYGMAPAQALCCGLPCVLTNWGGYSDFKIENNKSVNLIPVKFNQQKIEVNFKLCQKKIFHLATNSLSSNERQQNSTIYIKKLSSKENSKNLENILNSKVTSINNVSRLFYKVTSTISKNKIAPFRGRSGNYSDLYHELYQPYWK